MRMLKIQELYQMHKRDGVSDAHIYRAHINPTYPVSLPHFRYILARNVKKELAELAAAKDNPKNN